MQTTQLEVGETGYTWAIQLTDDPPARVMLPSWIAQVVELRVCKFVTEFDQWETRLQKRAVLGKGFTPKQQRAYDAWMLRNAQKIIFCKKRLRVVMDASEVSNTCICIQLHLSDDHEKLMLAANNGKSYRLMLLKSNTIKPSESLPSELDAPVLPGDLPEPEVHEDGDEKSDEGLMAVDEEVQKHMDADAANAMDFGVENPEDLCVLGDTDDEDEDIAWAGCGPKKVKTFMFRPVYAELASKGLCDIPNHVRGCSLACHGTARQWQGHYPETHSGLSATWGGATLRSEKEALLVAVRGVLTAHCSKYPKDKLWKAQLDKVIAAQAKR